MKYKIGQLLISNVASSKYYIGYVIKVSEESLLVKWFPKNEICKEYISILDGWIDKHQNYKIR